MRKMITAFLAVLLLMNVTGCTSRQPAPEAETEGQMPKQASETDIMSDFYEAQVLKEILAKHENVAENAVYYDAGGNVMLSVYQYADDETMVWEDNNSYIDIQHQDGYYSFDPDTMDKVQVTFGMEGVAEKQWEERLSGRFEFGPTEGEELVKVTESDGRIVLTIVSELEAEQLPGWGDEIEPGTQTVFEVEVDAETYIVYEAESHVRKPDGTEVKVGEFHFSYDIAPYEPSEEMLQVINGTDKTVILIADPGTEQEKTYVKSCGENGRLAVMLAEGYEKFYKDEACTQESEPSDENGERTIYTVKK